MFEWMAWTTPVAVFFVCIVLMLIGMTVWEVKSPTVLRKGFLPIETTRGDRLFIGLLTAESVVNKLYVMANALMRDAKHGSFCRQTLFFGLAAAGVHALSGFQVLVVVAGDHDRFVRVLLVQGLGDGHQIPRVEGGDGREAQRL